MPESLVPALTATCVATIIVTSVTVSLRFYVRLFIQRRFRVDDYLILFGYACLIASTICLLLQTGHCIGLHLVDLPLDEPELIKNALILLFAAQVLGSVATAAIKTAIAIFFLSVGNRIMKIIALSTAIFSTISAIGMTLFFAFQCKPVSYFWERFDFGGSTPPGSCLGPTSVYIMYTTFNGFDVATDVVLAGLPFILVRSMKNLHPLKKLGLALLLGLCVIDVIFPVVRFFYFKKTLYNASDPTYDTAYLIITLVAEPAIGLSICCAIQLQPLIRKVFPRSQPRVHQAAPNINQPPAAGQAFLSPKESAFKMSLLLPTCDTTSTMLSSANVSKTVGIEKGLKSIDAIVTRKEDSGPATSSLGTIRETFPAKSNNVFSG